MNKILATLSIILIASTIQADDYPYLTFSRNDGSEQSITAIGTTISFAGGELTAKNGNEQLSISLVDLCKMFFSDTTGIRDEVSMPTSQSIHIYTLSGVDMGIYSTIDSARSHLASGIYIIKSGNQTYKITIK